MDDKAFVLIVEDDTAHGQAIKESLERSGHICLLVNSGGDAIESVHRRPPDVVITDYKLGGDMSGLDVLREIKRLSPDTEVILITAYGNEGLAREVLSRDNEYQAYDYLIKPLDIDILREKADRAARLAIANRNFRNMSAQVERAFSFEGIIGGSEAMSRVVRLLKRLADSKITVLIFGESGTGKDLIAQAIHRNSPRKAKPYRVINCAGLNENILESELFGHVKGSFTGAVSDRKGQFEAADGGTLFLDEVGDMPFTMQSKLLRTLENGEVLPVGSNDVHRVDVRVVAATNQNLPEMVKNGGFREDLYYRLNQVAVTIPPLRARREDIPLLAHHFIERANAEHGKQVKTIVPQAVRKLTQYRWPGNVRELKSVIDAMVVLSEKGVLTEEDLPDDIRGSTEIVPMGSNIMAGLSMAEVERIHIINTLKLAGGNREKTAKILGIGARTLYRKLAEYGLK